MPLKILDYGEPNPFGEIIGRPRKLIWPVNAYRVTLPEQDYDDGPNMFERVILKIIDACGIRKADALAQETFIPVDMVKFILLRLKDKALINENNEILKQGRDNWMTEREPEFVTALVFRELATGKIFPFLHLLDNENPRKKEDDEKKDYRKIIRWDESHKERKPELNDVILALRAMKKRLSASNKYLRLPDLSQIIIENKPELYYLDCPIAIQKSDGEFRIADPFGYGFSMLLEHSFSQLLEQDDNLDKWLINWRERLSNPNPNKPADTSKEPFDTKTNRERYPNLIPFLRVNKNAQYRSIEQIYYALEWALFYACIYACIKRQYKAAVSELKFTDYYKHSGLLKDAAEKIGLDLPDNGFNPVLEGKLDDFLNGKAEMTTVMSIALLMAVKDPSHPLRKISNKHPDLIIRLLEIKEKRDSQEHGKGKKQKNEDKLPEDAFMCEIVTALLPDIHFSDTPTAAVDKDYAADILLDSRTNIIYEFGFKYFNRFGEDLQERLIYTENFWQSYKDGDNARAFVNDLYAALQAMFRKALAGTLPPGIDDSEFIEEAQKKAINTELGGLPESLRTVKSRMIRQTLQGDDQSLGACVVAFLLVSDNDTLYTISQIQPSFISDAADIIKRRGHGNEPLQMKKEEIKKLRKSVYSTIKTLLEV